MKQCILLALLVGLTTAEILGGMVDDVDYADEEDFANALGKWGVNLVDMDADQAVQGKTPDKIGIRGRDIKKSSRLSNSAVGYVLQFGFLEVATEKTEEELMAADTIIGEKELKKAIKKLQKFYGIKATGIVDTQTLNLMKQKRCGAKDVEYENPVNRAKRYTLSRKRWPSKTLKYWFDPTKYTADLALPIVRSEFERSLGLWAAQAGVSFEEVAVAADAHIKISWEYGDHGDGYPFYGPGGTLAHAFYPVKGMLHFDESEDYTAFTVTGTNLHYVATHEMGHILGLKHADSSLGNAIMYALYTGYSDNLQLHQDDIDGVVAAMGPGQGTVSPIGGSSDPDPEPATEPATPEPVDPPACIEKINAAFHWDYSPEYVYIFAGAWYYRLKPKNPDGGNFLPIMDTTAEPKLIGRDGFVGVPRHLDAAVETLEDGNKFYAFKGDKYVIYDIVSRRVTEDGVLADLWPENTPDKIEAAFKISKDALGFIVGDRLYKYSKSGKVWSVGAAGSNYFDKYDDLDSVSLAFYRSWAWAFRGAYYSVARSKNAKESSNYIMRSIKPDLKLPMCTEGVDQLSAGDLKKCKKELKKMKKKNGNYTPKAECKDYVAEKYADSVDFNRNHFD